MFDNKKRSICLWSEFISEIQKSNWKYASMYQKRRLIFLETPCILSYMEVVTDIITFLYTGNNNTMLVQYELILELSC